MYINITSLTILVALYNNHMKTHFLDQGLYQLDAEKAYSFPPTTIYSDPIQSYYHYVDHYLVSVLDTTCQTIIQIDQEDSYEDKSILSIKKVKAGYHQIFVSSVDDQCQPKFDRWIYNQTEGINIKQFVA